MVQTSTAHGERINLRPGETAKRRIEQAAFAALADPPPPGARLRAALAEHARRVARR